MIIMVLFLLMRLMRIQHYFNANLGSVVVSNRALASAESPSAWPIERWVCHHPDLVFTFLICENHCSCSFGDEKWEGK